MKFLSLILLGCIISIGSVGDPVADVWKRIEVARKGKVKEPSRMNPPAKKEDIDKLEKHLGCKIPEQLRTSLLLNDGMEDWGLEIVDGETTQLYRWLGVDGIQKQWDKDRKRQKEAEAEGDEFLVHPKWIPVFVEPVEHEEIIYVDTTNGTVLLRVPIASQEIERHRYTDLKTFLQVLEHHIRTGLRFEWGNDTESNPARVELTLNKEGIASLIKVQKESVVFKLADGKSVKIKEKGTEFANSVLESFRPVQFVRKPGVQNPDHELSFVVDGQSVLIAIKLAPEGMLSYSIGNTQFTGGDPAKLRELAKTLKKTGDGK